MFNVAMSESSSFSALPTREFAVSVLRGSFQEAVMNLPPEIAIKTDVELEAERKFSTVDFLLRKNLWRLVDLAYESRREFVYSADVYAGICSRTNFEERVLKNPFRVAWIMIRPQSVSAMLEAGLEHGIKNLIKFVSNEPTPETVSAFIKAIEILLNRVQGPIIHRIDARHAHAHVKLTSALPKHLDPDARLEELKSKLLWKSAGVLSSSSSGSSE